MQTRKFQIGDDVNLYLPLLRWPKPLSCKIAQLVPFEGKSFQYQVKIAGEPFARVVEEEHLSK